MTTDQDASPAFRGWCVLELFGHRRLGGYLSAQEIAGAAFLRIDIPGPSEVPTTQFYSAAAVYAITPTTEELARSVAAANQPEPVHRWELPPPLAVDDPDEVEEDLEHPF